MNFSVSLCLYWLIDIFIIVSFRFQSQFTQKLLNNGNIHTCPGRKTICFLTVPSKIPHKFPALINYNWPISRRRPTCHALSVQHAHFWHFPERDGMPERRFDLGRPSGPARFDRFARWRYGWPKGPYGYRKRYATAERRYTLRPNQIIWQT